MAKRKNIHNSPPIYVLPSNNKELQTFTKQFKVDMMEQVVNIIEFAVDNDLPMIEVFQFQNSDFVITLSEKDYLNNLENIYSYYLSKEIYEHCSRIVKLQKTLKKYSIKTNETKT